jgi:hypothetical protein
MERIQRLSHALNLLAHLSLFESCVCNSRKLEKANNCHKKQSNYVCQLTITWCSRADGYDLEMILIRALHGWKELVSAECGSALFFLFKKHPVLFITACFHISIPRVDQQAPAHHPLDAGWCPLWLSCGWPSTELIQCFSLVTHSLRNRWPQGMQIVYT